MLIKHCLINIIDLSFMWIAAAVVSMHELVTKWVRVDVRMTKTYKAWIV